jgi:hypothetical protein
MKYKLYLWVFCAALQGSVQAEGEFFSGMKNKALGWWNSKPVTPPSNKEVEERLKKIPEYDERAKNELCQKFSDSSVCKTRALKNLILENKLAARRSMSLGLEVELALLDQKTSRLIDQKTSTSKICEQSDFSTLLENANVGLSCEEFMTAVRLEKEKNNSKGLIKAENQKELSLEENQKELSIDEKTKITIDTIMETMTPGKAKDAIRNICKDIKYGKTQACKAAAIRDPEVKKATETAARENKQEISMEEIVANAGGYSAQKDRKAKIYF